MPGKHPPGYQTAYQRARSRAIRRLIHEAETDGRWPRYLNEERNKEQDGQ